MIKERMPYSLHVKLVLSNKMYIALCKVNWRKIIVENLESEVSSYHHYYHHPKTLKLKRRTKRFRNFCPYKAQTIAMYVFCWLLMCCVVVHDCYRIYLWEVNWTGEMLKRITCLSPDKFLLVIRKNAKPKNIITTRRTKKMPSHTAFKLLTIGSVRLRETILQHHTHLSWLVSDW